MIPQSANGCQQVAISDFCKTGSGGTPSRSKASQYFGGTIPWVKSGELRETTITDTEEKITELALNESAARILPKDTLLVALYGATVGRIGVLGIEAATNQAVCHIIPDEKRANRTYLFYALQAQVPFWLKQRVGGGQPNISQGIIKQTKIPLPPLSEQKRIADILEKADAIRRKRNLISSLAATLAPSLFQEMFTSKVGRLAGKLIEPSDTLAGKQLVAKGWTRTTLGSQITLQRGIDITSSNHRPGMVPVISSGGISGFHDTPYTQGPGVLLGRKGSVGSVHFVEGPYWPHDTTLWVREFKMNNARFVYEFFRHFPIGDYEASTANPSLNRNNLHPVDVWWPPRSLQQRFSDLVAHITKQTMPRIEKGAKGTATLFDSVVQRAFRGEL